MSDTINVVVVYPDTYGGYQSDIPVYQNTYNLSTNIGSVMEGQKLICEYYSDEWLRIVGVIHNIGQDGDELWLSQYNNQLDTLIGGYIDKSFTFELKSNEEYDASLDKLTEREMVYDIYSRLRFGKKLEDPDKYRTHSIQSSANNYYGNQYGYYNDPLVPATALVKKISAKLIMSMPQTISKNISRIHTVTIPISSNSYDRSVSAIVYGDMELVLAYLEKAMVDVSSIMTTETIYKEYNYNYKELYPVDITDNVERQNLPNNISIPQGYYTSVKTTKFTLNWDSPGFANGDNLKIYYVYKNAEEEITH